jgi:hypothetical protein
VAAFLALRFARVGNRQRERTSACQAEDDDVRGTLHDLVGVWVGVAVLAAAVEESIAHGLFAVS